MAVAAAAAAAVLLLTLSVMLMLLLCVCLWHRRADLRVVASCISDGHMLLYSPARMDKWLV